METIRVVYQVKILVCLEVGLGGTGAFVPDCPGCWVFGRTPRSALKKVRDAVVEWFVKEWSSLFFLVLPLTFPHSCVRYY